MDYAGYVKSFYKYSVQYFGITAILNCRKGDHVNSIQMICVHKCKHLLHPVTVKKGTTQFIVKITT